MVRGPLAGASADLYTGRMVKAVIFDFDGVLVDSEPLHYQAIHRVTERFGVRFSYGEYVDRLIGYDDRDALRVALGGSPGSDDALPAGHTLADLCASKTEAFTDIVAEGIDAIPGAVELVRHLHGQVPICIASGAVRSEIDICLKHLGLIDAFKLIVSADQVARSKPDPQTYVMAVDQLSAKHPEADLSADTCVAIEDTPAGVAAARGAGLTALALTSTNTSQRLHDAHRVVETLVGIDLDQLRQWFG